LRLTASAKRVVRAHPQWTGRHFSGAHLRFRHGRTGMRSTLVAWPAPSPLGCGQRAERCLLRSGGGTPSLRQVVATIMGGEVHDRLVDSPCELFGGSRVRQAPKVGWERRAPVHANVPRAALVGEK